MDIAILESKYELVRRVCKIANSVPDLRERLQMVVDLISEEMRIDSCSIYLMDDDSKLVLKATNGLHPDSVDLVKLNINEGITGKVVAEKKTIFTSDARSHPDFLFVPVTGEEQFQSIISTPVMSGDECVGVINVQTKAKRDFSSSEIESLETLAEQISGIIKNSQLYEKNAAGLRELSIIHETAKKINSTLILSDLLHTISRSGCEVIKADCSALWLRDEKGGTFEKKCIFGPEADRYMIQTFKTCEADDEDCGHTCRIDASKLPQYHHKHEVNISCPLGEEIREKYMCMPVFSPANLIGMISVYREKPYSKITHYSKHEKRLLALLANQAGLAISNALTHHDLENLNTRNQAQLRELNILYKSAQAMGTNMDLEKCLRMILNAVTVGNGLGFNRAILFMVNEDDSILQGMMGVGPESAEEAGRIWSRLSHQKTYDLFEWLIQSTEEPLESNSHFNELSKSLRIPMKPSGCVLSRTVTEKKSFNINDAWNHDDVNKELLEKLTCDSFATIPLLASEKALGVILVDNLYTGNLITDTDLQFLSHFGRQAGWAIQNSSVFTKLEKINRDLFLTQKRLSESEHLAALGEISAEIAHEIKNPLVSIGGFARRLVDKLEESNPSKKYARIVMDESLRLDQLLKNVLNYTRKIDPQFTAGNLNTTIQSVVHLVHIDLDDKNIELHCELGEDVPDTFFDPNQMKQVITNLISNAIESMSNTGGVLKVNTYKECENTIILKVSDTGGGMTEEVAKNVFNPFFTTKETGSGIGLPLVKKIVENHHGKIGVENLSGVGVELTIALPCNITPIQAKENYAG